MNWLDISLLVLLALAAFAGWRRGVVRTAVMAGGAVAGVYLAGRLSGPLAERLTFLTQPDVARFLAFALVFVAVLAASAFLGGLLKRMLNLLFLGWVDNLAGAAAGFLTAVVVLTGVIVSAGSLLPGVTGGLIRGSPVARALADNVPLVLALLPERFRDVLTFVARPSAPTASLAGVERTPEGALRVRIRLENPNPYGGSLDAFSVAVYDGKGGAVRVRWEEESPGRRVPADAEADLDLLSPPLDPLPEAGREVWVEARLLLRFADTSFEVVAEGAARVE